MTNSVTLSSYGKENQEPTFLCFDGGDKYLLFDFDR